MYCEILVKKLLSVENSCRSLMLLTLRVVVDFPDFVSSADSKCKEESAKLLGCLICNCERLIHPYVAPIHKVLVVCKAFFLPNDSLSKCSFLPYSIKF